ncbi:MAG: DUF4290 domain-containing protein [Bacteroidales bacterium]|nr:DUF4290 domain-containing protein [Bacteroidales bacterium]
MNYNTTKEKITIKEYGRHVQMMVDYLLSIEDRDLRTLQAKATVRTMACFSPGTKDTPDYWQKLWDHLHIISNYELDVDSPFPKPEPSDIEAKPSKIAYQKNQILYPPYGKLIEEIIKSVAEEPDSEEKNMCIENIAVHLKKQYLLWNRDSVNDDMIVEQLETLSNGKLKLKEDFQFPATKDLLEQLPKVQENKKKNNNQPKRTNTATQSTKKRRKKRK